MGRLQYTAQLSAQCNDQRCDAHGYVWPCVTCLAVACRQAWLITCPKIGSRGRSGVADSVWKVTMDEEKLEGVRRT